MRGSLRPAKSPACARVAATSLCLLFSRPEPLLHPREHRDLLPQAGTGPSGIAAAAASHLCRPRSPGPALHVGRWEHPRLGRAGAVLSHSPKWSTENGDALRALGALRPGRPRGVWCSREGASVCARSHRAGLPGQSSPWSSLPSAAEGITPLSPGRRGHRSREPGERSSPSGLQGAGCCQRFSVGSGAFCPRDQDPATSSSPLPALLSVRPSSGAGGRVPPRRKSRG